MAHQFLAGAALASIHHIRLVFCVALMALMGACDDADDFSNFSTLNPPVNAPVAPPPMVDRVGPTPDATVSAAPAGAPSQFFRLFDIAAQGYVEEEFFISGTARSFRPVSALNATGPWPVETAGDAAYTTRIVVYRPVDLSAFNGTVIVEWMNVSSGFDIGVDWINLHTEIIREGYIWVGVSAQQTAISGSAAFALQNINPSRYASLSHPGDDFSYDIFSQVAKALRTPVGVNPLDGVFVETLIAAGQSQSANRLVTYINAVHPEADEFDAFFVHSRTRSPAPLAPFLNGDEARGPSETQVFGNGSEPVLTFQAEGDIEVLGSAPTRQADNASFRYWEVAGGAHSDLYFSSTGLTDLGGDPNAALVVENASPQPPFVVCDLPVNALPLHLVIKAGFSALNEWTRGGAAPPSVPFINLDADGNVVR
ncbi:MAG: alpha/beta hydrolase domain-containing protein, partial [Pseudomonadota bacterium]